MRGQAKLSQGHSLFRSRQGMPSNSTPLFGLIVGYNLIEPIRMTAKEDSETSMLRKKISCKEGKGVKFQKKMFVKYKTQQRKM